MSESPRSSSQPHPPAIPLGNGGDYYIPGKTCREPGVVLAAWLLLATDEEAPEVRASLRSEVFPLVPKGEAYFDAWRNQEGVLDFCADDWTLPKGRVYGAGRWAGRPRAPMVPCILALRAWSRRYRLASAHVAAVVVAVLKDWLLGEFFGPFGAGSSLRDGWGKEINFLAHGWNPFPEDEEEAWRQLLVALPLESGLASFNATIEESWEPRLETRLEFAKRMEARFARQLERYFAASARQLEEHGFKKVPRKKARHHLTWLVQHRICGLTCEEITDRYAEQNPRLESPPTPDAVAKAIRRTAAIIELP